MKIDIKQENAKKWSSVLKKLNESQPGFLQVVFQNEQGKKEVGYANLLDIALEVDGASRSLGSILEEVLGGLTMLADAYNSLCESFSNAYVIKKDGEYIMDINGTLQPVSGIKIFEAKNYPYPLKFYKVVDNELILDMTKVGAIL